MLPQSLLSKSTTKLWIALSVCSVAASSLLMIRHTAHSAASKNCPAGYAPIAVQATDTVTPIAETPILIDRSPGQDKRRTIGIVGNTSVPNFRVSTLGSETIMPAWTANRTGVLAVESGKRTLIYCPFDAASQTFGAAQRVDQRYANPGVSYELSIHSEFALSRAESKIVYEENKRIVVFDLRTGGKKGLPTRSSLHLATPSWSPDGSSIAFSSYGEDSIDPARSGEGDTFDDTWLMNADGSHLRRLGHGVSPHWSNDGHSLLVTMGGGGGAIEIGEYDLTAHNRYRTIRRCDMLFPDGHLYPYQGFDDAVYSPDGKYIALFGASDTKKEDQGLFMVDTKGHFIRMLIKGAQFSDLSRPVRLAW